MRDKKWFYITIIEAFLALSVFSLPTIIIDPFFHFHEPISDYGYTYGNQRYINDGIVRNFDYDAFIVGTSMVENFSVSEASSLFECNFIKVPYSGGYYKEIDYLIQRAFSSDNDIKIIIRSLDFKFLIQDKDAEHAEEDPLQPKYRAPEYLINSNIFDDVKYVLNKDVLLGNTYPTVVRMESKSPNFNFDDYSNWSSLYKYGVQAVLESYEHSESVLPDKMFTNDDYEMIKGNLEQNVIPTITNHPNTTFYLFFPPYSICYWDICHANGTIRWNVEAEQVAIEMLLEQPNVKLFSFANDFEMICNLDNYRDQGHYGEWINSIILLRMKNGDNELTLENYKEYLAEIEDYYINYDYSIFSGDSK